MSCTSLGGTMIYELLLVLPVVGILHVLIESATLAIDGSFLRKWTRTILYKCTKPFCLLLWLLDYYGNLKRFIMPLIYYSSQLINWKLVYLYQLGFNTWQWGLWKYSGIFDYLKAGVHYIFQFKKKYLLLPVLIFVLSLSVVSFQTCLPVLKSN